MAYIDSGNMPWQPNFSLSVEGEDITDIVRENLVNLTLKDHGAGSKKVMKSPSAIPLISRGIDIETIFAYE
ncbi:hypothetical protein [Serratia rhizosphaerae]|uniref:Uncharacterized protein n=1 Tax=Serratia rhizosphaerae TaxID=2597702 RepID=A0ABX6GHG4_9GAMM|nr:hypothetical protein [Serratia rhizosphaerae]QHA85674.1 hypothetical protein FO014_01035 [Serratia rhizosphaerae]